MTDFLRHAAAVFNSQPVTEVRLTGKEPASASRMLERPPASYNLACRTFVEENPGYWWSHTLVEEEGRDREWWVPREIFNIMWPIAGRTNLEGPAGRVGRVGFPTTESALAALSWAYVKWGRRAAGLSDLTEQDWMIGASGRI